MTTPAIDLSRYQAAIPSGEFVLFTTWLHWLSPTNENLSEPALVVVPRYRRDGYKPAVVALSAAFKYSSPEYCARASKQFVQNFGMTDSMSTAHALATLIYDHLNDLLKMPNSPTELVIVGEARIHDGSYGGKLVQIVDHDVMKQQ